MIDRKHPPKSTGYNTDLDLKNSLFDAFMGFLISLFSGKLLEFYDGANEITAAPRARRHGYATEAEADRNPVTLAQYRAMVGRPNGGFATAEETMRAARGEPTAMSSSRAMRPGIGGGATAEEAMRAARGEPSWPRPRPVTYIVIRHRPGER
jgi:hypothetical protein